MRSAASRVRSPVLTRLDLFSPSLLPYSASGGHLCPDRSAMKRNYYAGNPLLLVLFTPWPIHNTYLIDFYAKQGKPHNLKLPVEWYHWTPLACWHGAAGAPLSSSGKAPQRHNFKTLLLAPAQPTGLFNAGTPLKVIYYEEIRFLLSPLD